MSRVLMSKEERHFLHNQYLSDKRLSFLRKELSKAYGYSEISYLFKSNGDIEVIYDDILLKRISILIKRINQIIETDYSDLFDNDTRREG